MKVRSHLGKISWSLADKGLYVLYGLVQMYQFFVLPTDVVGVFEILVVLNTYIMIVSDGSALQGIIQFGTREDERRRVNTLALLIHSIITVVSVALVWLLQGPLIELFNEPRFATVAAVLPWYCLLTMPRMLCLKFLYRDMRMRDLFVVDLVWFGVRTAMTFWLVSQNRFHTIDDLVLVDLAGMAASSLVAMVITRRDLVFGMKGDIPFRDYVRFGVPLALATALNSAPKQLDILIIQSYFGAVVVGVYGQAKKLYKLFEQVFDAATALLYPAAVRIRSQHRDADMVTLVTKAISVTLVPTIVLLIFLELGGSNVIPALLGPKFNGVIVHFNVLILAALGMPFLLMSSILQAYGHSLLVVRYSAVGMVISIASLIAIGELGQPSLVGVAIVVNAWVVGILCTIGARRDVPFPWSAVWRSVGDFKGLVRSVRGGS